MNKQDLSRDSADGGGYRTSGPLIWQPEVMLTGEGGVRAEISVSTTNNGKVLRSVRFGRTSHTGRVTSFFRPEDMDNLRAIMDAAEEVLQQEGP